jgi:hypothetical protein
LTVIPGKKSCRFGRLRCRRNCGLERRHG